MPEVPGWIPGGDVQFSFYFLVHKKFDDSDKILSLNWPRPFTKRTRDTRNRQIVATMSI